jgi:cytochrome c biogenesis protein CcdA
MTLSLLLTLIGIGLVDALNPSLFVAQFYLLATPRPAWRVLAFIAGVLVVMVGGGILILAGFRTVIADLLAAVPQNALLAAQLAVGAAALAFGLLYDARPAAAGEVRKPVTASVWAAFLLGIVVMINEISTALPYFVAIERIADARMSWPENMMALAIYNLIFVLPLFGFLGAFLALEQRFTAQVAAINAWVQRWMPRLLKGLSLAAGIVLLVDGLGRLLGLLS